MRCHEYKLEPVGDLVNAVFDCDTCHLIILLLQAVVNPAQRMRGTTCVATLGARKHEDEHQVKRRCNRTGHASIGFGEISGREDQVSALTGGSIYDLAVDTNAIQLELDCIEQERLPFFEQSEPASCAS